MALTVLITRPMQEDVKAIYSFFDTTILEACPLQSSEGLLGTRFKPYDLAV